MQKRSNMCTLWVAAMHRLRGQWSLSLTTFLHTPPVPLYFSYMVDSADHEKLDASKNELHSLLDKPQLAGIPVRYFLCPSPSPLFFHTSNTPFSLPLSCFQYSSFFFYLFSLSLCPFSTPCFVLPLLPLCLLLSRSSLPYLPPHLPQVTLGGSCSFRRFWSWAIKWICLTPSENESWLRECELFVMIQFHSQSSLVSRLTSP